jgi:iron-sulfur cluster repair protein YtfE (RIC family)
MMMAVSEEAGAGLQPLAELTIDEGRRPKAPRIEGATPAHRAQGRRLALIHRMHLEDLDLVGRLLGQVERGEAEAGRLADEVRALQMTRNYRAFGTLCGRECQVLSFHHTAEDRQIFPQLGAAGSPGLRAVIAQLQAEHEVVHALIERLEVAADGLVARPDAVGFAAAREVFRALEGVVRSHFGYEETELEEALGFHGVI